MELNELGMPLIHPDSLFFNDGVKRIDFILVYEKDDTEGKKEKKRVRKEYEDMLIARGMDLEETESSDKQLMFVKIHMPWESLCEIAEELHIKVPIKLPSMDPSSMDPSKKSFTVPFENDRMEHFDIDPNNPDATFTPSMRIRMASYILSLRVNAEGVDHPDITKLLADGVYKDAFPLHDGSINGSSIRFKLYQEWAHLKNFCKRQPLDLIRMYHGEKTGIYFAFLEFYTNMLAHAAIVGVLCFIYGLITIGMTTWSKEVCDPEIGGTIVMCPQCDKECPYWKLNSTCATSKIHSIFDNYGTLMFAVFMTIWVTFFLELWKRYQEKLEHKWSTIEFLEQDEPPRPEYEYKCKHSDTWNNPVTKEEERLPYEPCKQRALVSLGIVAVLFCLLLIPATVMATIIFRLHVFFTFSDQLRSSSNSTSTYADRQMAISFKASVTILVCIMILKKVIKLFYGKVAVYITDFEFPRTKTEYENSLTLKMFFFQFFTFFSACFYIGFIKGKVVGHPGKPVYILGTFRNEECAPQGCMQDLTLKLAVIMAGNAILTNIQEFVLPPLWRWLKNLRCWSHIKFITQLVNYLKCWSQASVASGQENIPRWEQDYQLAENKQLGLLYEYLEMVIQFGFVTMFATAFPLAPVLALINNLFMIRIDAWKITSQFRRMVPDKVQDIRVWMPILHGITILAVATNVMIIAFTSDMIPRLVYYWSFSVYPYGDHSHYTMEGYINNTLSVFNIEDFTNQSKPTQANTPDWFANSTTCRYRDFRYPPGHPRQYEFNKYYWHVLTARLAFIVVVEQIVYLTRFVLSYVIPHVAETGKAQIKQDWFQKLDIMKETEVEEAYKKGIEEGKQGGKERGYESIKTWDVLYRHASLRRKDLEAPGERASSNKRRDLFYQTPSAKPGHQASQTTHVEEGIREPEDDETRSKKFPMHCSFVYEPVESEAQANYVTPRPRAPVRPQAPAMSASKKKSEKLNRAARAPTTGWPEGSERWNNWNPPYNAVPTTGGGPPPYPHPYAPRGPHQGPYPNPHPATGFAPYGANVWLSNNQM